MVLSPKKKVTVLVLYGACWLTAWIISGLLVSQICFGHLNLAEAGYEKLFYLALSMIAGTCLALKFPFLRPRIKLPKAPMAYLRIIGLAATTIILMAFGLTLFRLFTDFNGKPEDIDFLFWLGGIFFLLILILVETVFIPAVKSKLNQGRSGQC